jgi:signal transduction histidine kinase
VSITYPQLRLFLDGMLTMIAVYALLSFVQHQRAIFWQYALYIGCMMLTFYLIDRQYESPSYLPGDRYEVVVVESVALMLYIRFAALLMDFRLHDALSHRLTKAMLWLLAGHIALHTLLRLSNAPVPVQSGLYVAGRVLLVGLALWVVPRIVRLKQTIVTYFIAGAICFITGSVMALVINFVPAWSARQPDLPFTYPITFMEAGVVLEVLCFTLGISMRQRQIEQIQLATQLQLIDQLRENERNQQKIQRIRADIARDLHDDVGGDLSSISMLSEAADRQLVSRPEEARALLRLIGESSRQVLANMRQIVWTLRDTTTASQPAAEPLSCHLRETAHTLFEHQATRIELDLPDEQRIGGLPTDLCRDLHLLCKEALHNVVRHAAANRVVVTLRLTDEQLYLHVTDDGVGFDPANVPVGSNGIASMRQRAADMGGSLLITSEPGRGTSCLLEVALQEATATSYTH